MDNVIAALAEQQAELSGLVDGLESDWERPSRCAGWTVADVVLHLAQTNELAVASATGRYTETLAALGEGLGTPLSIDEGADLLVARERGGPVGALRARWEASAAAQLDALRECDPRARVTWVAGELSAKTLATTRLAETWIHTGDVAAAFGRVPVATDRIRHIARLAWRTLPYAFAQAGRQLSGPVAFDLRSPSDDAWQFVPDDEPLTVIRGDAAELCSVAARRADPAETGLRGQGPDVDAVLQLVRTYA